MTKVIVAIIGGALIDDQGICGVYDNPDDAKRAVEAYILEHYPDDGIVSMSNRKWVMMGGIIRYVDVSSETVLGAIVQMEMNQKEYVSMI